MVLGGEVQKEVRRFVYDFCQAGVRPVDLVDDDDRVQPNLKRLAEDELRLRHGAFHRVYQQQAAVGHVQDALHFAAEVRVAWCVDDVDAHAAVLDGDVLRHDRDPLFALQGVRIEDQSPDHFVFTKDVGLLEEGIDQGGFPVVNMGDDGEVAHVGAARLH